MINKFNLGRFVHPRTNTNQLFETFEGGGDGDGRGLGGRIDRPDDGGTGECNTLTQNCGPGFICKQVTTTNSFGTPISTNKCVAITIQEDDTPPPTPTPAPTSSTCARASENCNSTPCCNGLEASFNEQGLCSCLPKTDGPTPTATPAPTATPEPTPTPTAAPKECKGNTSGPCPEGFFCREFTPSVQGALPVYACAEIGKCSTDFIECNGLDGIYFSGGAPNKDGFCPTITVKNDEQCKITPTPTPTPTITAQCGGRFYGECPTGQICVTDQNVTFQRDYLFGVANISFKCITPPPPPVCERTYSCDGTTAIVFDGTVTSDGVTCKSTTIPNDSRCTEPPICECSIFEYGTIGNSYQAACDSTIVNQFNKDCKEIVHQAPQGTTTCTNPFNGYFSTNGRSFFYEQGILRNSVQCKTPTNQPLPDVPFDVPVPTEPPPPPPLPPIPPPAPVVVWRNCIDGTLNPAPVPPQYKSSRYLGEGGGVCWEPRTIISFEPSLNTALNFLYNRGSEKYPTALSIKAVNPSYATMFEVSFETNTEVNITPNKFTVRPRGSFVFSLNPTPPLYQKLGDGESVLSLNVDITEV